MYRLLFEKLIEWKDNPGKKPLILRGVRQCGKTFLLKEFGAKHYGDVFYCKFDEDRSLEGFFTQNLDPARIIKDMSIYRGKDIKPRSTLVIFDEIQSCGPALTSLKYFYEDAPEYHIIAAGSLLGVAVPKGTSFPVGKVEFLNLYPMNFYEFLYANNPMLAQHIKDSAPGDAVWRPFKAPLEEMYREYQVVGGMPEAVQCWIDTKSFEGVEKIQSQIIMGYENDFAKHAPLHYYPKLSAIWNAVPSQLAKENRKFIFSQVKKGWRAKDLEDALEWLVQSGLVYKVVNIEKPFIPISSYANHAYFKLYLSDIGLLRRLANLPPSALFENAGGNSAFSGYTEFKGAMAENYVCCELKRIYETNIFYWTAEGTAKAEIDFVVQDGADIIPIEVKAGTAVHARSLGQYCKKYNPAISVLTSMDHDKDHILPLYIFWNFKQWINRAANRALSP